MPELFNAVFIEVVEDDDGDVGAIVAELVDWMSRRDDRLPLS